MINLESRITPKFKNSTNFKNILDFLTTHDTSSLKILNDVSNLDSEYTLVLDEIGKTLGVYPRPYVPLLIDGYPSRFTLDISLLDTVPMTNDDEEDYRPMSNEEYSKILRVTAKGINFRGTVQEWEDILYILTDAVANFDSQPSRFGLVVQKDLTIVEKAITKYALKQNLLTINIDYIGTTADNETPLVLDIGNLDESVFIEPW